MGTHRWSVRDSPHVHWVHMLKRFLKLCLTLEVFHTRKTWHRTMSIPASVLSKTKSPWKVMEGLLHHHGLCCVLQLSLHPSHQFVSVTRSFILKPSPLARCWSHGAARLVERCRKLLCKDVSSGFTVPAVSQPLQMYLQAAEGTCRSALLEG